MGQSLKQQEWKKNHYKLNKENYIDKQRQRRQHIRDLINSLKKPCVVCGENDNCCIDFHHIDSNEKEMEISNIVKNKWSDKKTIEEIAKCVSLCSNHHRKLHFYELTVDELIYKYKITGCA